MCDGDGCGPDVGDGLSGVVCREGDGEWEFGDGPMVAWMLRSSETGFTMVAFPERARWAGVDSMRKDLRVTGIRSGGGRCGTRGEEIE